MEPPGTLLGSAEIQLGQQKNVEGHLIKRMCVCLCVHASVCVFVGRTIAECWQRGKGAVQVLIDRPYLSSSTLPVSARVDMRRAATHSWCLSHLTSGIRVPNSALTYNYSFASVYECVCVCVFLPCAVGNHISHSAESLCLLTSTMSQWDSFPQSVRSNRFLYWCENCRTIRQSDTYFSLSSSQKCTAHLRQNKNITVKKEKVSVGHHMLTRHYGISLCVTEWNVQHGVTLD